MTYLRTLWDMLRGMLIALRNPKEYEDFRNFLNHLQAAQDQVNVAIVVLELETRFISTLDAGKGELGEDSQHEDHALAANNHALACMALAVALEQLDEAEACHFLAFPAEKVRAVAERSDKWLELEALRGKVRSLIHEHQMPDQTKLAGATPPLKVRYSARILREKL
jgi:hypothetical protein